MARYFSKEGVDQSIDIINNSKDHLEKAKLLTGKVLLRVFDDPDGKDILVSYTFDKGRVRDYTYEAEDAPSGLRDRAFRPMVDGLARVSAKYATFVKLDTGEMATSDTVDSPDYEIEGNMLMIMPLMQSFDSWNRVVRGIEKTY